MNKQARLILKERCNNRCYYCGMILHKRFHMDHFFPKKLEYMLDSDRMMERVFEDGDAPVGLIDINDLRNMVPSCSRCNSWKHSLLVSRFKASLNDMVNKLLKYSNQFVIARDFNQIHITHEPVIFYFETDEMIDKHNEIFKQ